MKYKLLLILNVFLLIPLVSLSAQDKKVDDRKRQDLENFRAQRVAYFTKEIGLTEEEAKEFWSVCNELEEKIFEVNRSMRVEIRRVRELQKAGKSVSETEYDQLIDLVLDSKDKELALEKEYIKKLRKVLSPEKVFKYQRAEFKFAKEAFLPPPSSAKK